MEDFKNQLSILIPLTTNILIKLDKNLRSVEDKIKICKERIESKQILLRCENAKEFISTNTTNYQQYSCVLSRLIAKFSKINSDFIKFEYEILDYKASKFKSIDQLIEDRLDMNDWSTTQLSTILVNVQESFKMFSELNKMNLIKRNQIDQAIPLISDQLVTHKQRSKELNEKYSNLNELANHKQKALIVVRYQQRGKQQIYELNYQTNLLTKSTLKNENHKLIELKCRIRKNIFEYLNKIKRLNQLTDDKNRKIVEFKNLFSKYNKNSIVELTEKRLSLKLKIDNFDKLNCNDDVTIVDEMISDTMDENTNRNMINKQENVKEDRKNKTRNQKKETTKQQDIQPVDHQSIKNGLQSDENAKFIEQLKDQNSEVVSNLIDKLNCLDRTYDELIDRLDSKIENKAKTMTQSYLNLNKNDDEIYNSLKSKSKSYERK